MGTGAHRPASHESFRRLKLFLKSATCDKMLTSYANREYSPEGLMFLREASAYIDLKRTDPNIYEHLLDTFVRIGSAHEINISGELRAALLSRPDHHRYWVKAVNDIAEVIQGGQLLRMSAEATRLVKHSWAKALATGRIMDKFYGRVFAVMPETRRMFRSDLGLQKKMFEHMITASLTMLTEFDQLIESTAMIAKTHIKLNLTRLQFRLLGEQLIKSLAEVLGEDFDGATRAAWEMVYELLATMMMIVIEQGETDSSTSESSSDSDKMDADDSDNWPATAYSPGEVAMPEDLGAGQPGTSSQPMDESSHLLYIVPGDNGVRQRAARSDCVFCCWRSARYG